MLQQLSYDIWNVVDCLGICDWRLLKSEPEGEISCAIVGLYT